MLVDFDQQGKFSRIKLIDLGDSVKIEPTTDHVFGHPVYQPPEGLLELPWTTKVDLWGLGTMVRSHSNMNRSYVKGEAQAS